MLNTPLIAAIVGCVLGFLGGLGIGGGSLLILWLTLFIGTEYSTAKGINLLFFLPCAICSIICRRHQLHFRFKKIIPAMISGCFSAAAFSWLGRSWNINLLQTIFGWILLFTGLRELFYRPRKAK